MRGRWLAVGGLSVFVLGIALGGVVRRRAAVVPAAPAPVASRCASAVADARKAAATACLLRELPHDFDPSMDPLEPAIEKCLGKTPLEIAAKGVSRVQFGRDARNGMALDLIVGCGNHCPDDTSTALVYAKPLSEKECLCVGGGPRIAMGGGYEGCGPGPPATPGLELLAIEHAPGKRGRFRVMGGFTGTRLLEAGIYQGRVLLSADGQPIRSAAEARKVILHFPFDPPRSVTLQMSHSDKLEIRYVGWDVIQRLARQAHELEKRFGYPKVCCQSRGHVAFVYGGHRIGLGCHDAATKAWLAFGRSLASVHATPGVPRGPQGFPGCSALRDTQIRFHPIGGSGDVEIMYVGWLGAASGDRWDGGM